MDDLELFLAHADADGHRPVLAEGLPPAALTSTTHVEQEQGIILDYASGDPQSLQLQRWALIVPDTPEGKTLEGAVGELRRAREQGQGAPVQVHRVPAGMDAAAALQWKNKVYG